MFFGEVTLVSKVISVFNFAINLLRQFMPSRKMDGLFSNKFLILQNSLVLCMCLRSRELNPMSHGWMTVTLNSMLASLNRDQCYVIYYSG